jgi:hypothetical protein
MKPTLIVGKERLAIIQLGPNAVIPNIEKSNSFWSITRTEEELSIVLMENIFDPEVKSERGWRNIKVKGPLDFSLTGIIASISTPLAKAGISIFVISTFNTDYILVKEDDLEEAITVLINSGFEVTKH